MQQASLYYHIKNKEDLLHGICYSTFLQIVEGADAAVAGAPDAHSAFREIARSHLTTTLTYQSECTVSLMECRALGLEYRAEIEALWSRYHMLAYEVLDAAKLNGTIRADLPNKYIYTPLMCTLNWPILWYRPGQGLSVEELDALVAKVYFGGAGQVGKTPSDAIRDTAQRLDLRTETMSASTGQQANETYNRLLDVSCALFARKGYQATSIREIAAAMGIQKASLYYYITGKEELLVAISRAAMTHLRHCVEWALAQAHSPAERLYAFIVAHVVSLLQHQNWHAAANEELLTFPGVKRAEIVALRDEYESMLRDILLEAQEAGILRTDISAKNLGLILFGIITNIYPWYQPNVDVAPRELGRTLADLFLNGIDAHRV